MLNKVILQGRLTRDIDLRQTNSGMSCATFSIAVKRGNKSEITDFITCVAWKLTAEFISKYFHKGDMILVEGKLTTRKFTTKNGDERTATEVNVDSANFCGSKKDATEQAEDTSRFVEYDEDDSDFPF